MTAAASTSFVWTVPADPAAGQIILPFDPRAVFGRARPPVVVTVGAYRYPSTIAIMAGETFVPFRHSHRTASGVRAGDTVTVTVTHDTAPRVVAVPDELAVALSAHGLQAAWQRLSFTRQREQVEAILAARRPATRERRLAATIALLGSAST